MSDTMSERQCVHILDGFLGSEANAALLAQMTLLKTHMGEVTSSGNVSERFSSSIVGEESSSVAARRIQKMMAENVRRVLPAVYETLEFEPFAEPYFTMLIAAHRNGDKYSPHQDNQTRQLATRRITLCYYFSQIPRPYSGGDLIFFTDPGGRPGQPCCRVASLNDRLVCFRSDAWHEVTKIQSDDNYLASRFSLTGWVHSGYPRSEPSYSLSN